MTRLYAARNGQLAMFNAAKAGAQDNHAGRGMSFEAALNDMHALYHARKLALISKQHVPALPVKDGKWAKVIGKSTVDYVGLLADGRFVAFDAKDCAGKKIELSRLQDHQRAYLSMVRELGGVAFVLVRFERRDVYTIPIRAWDMAVRARQTKPEIDMYVGAWQATGKASINASELPAAWRVDGCDWAKGVR